MTTNLQSLAGSSSMVTKPASDISDTPSTTSEVDELREIGPDEIGGMNGTGKAGPSGTNGQNGLGKQAVTVDDKGEMTKVPAFLNKLYSMVSDATTDELIYWSESGDSFYVPNTERFGKELLPRFFKHSNFSSFVRQLNMYGFHKVPQAQTGVLRADSPNELWEFVNPFFKRDQPQLLNQVTRKNNRPNMPQVGANQGFRTTRSADGTFHPVHLITDGSTEGEAGLMISPGQQMLDLSAITSGIAAIRQSQATIVGDLKALQASNEHLWREALESRERQTKHEETIDLIVSFLERLFGTEGAGLKGLKEAMRRGGIARTTSDGVYEEPASAKKRRKLGLDRMISDAPNQEGDDGQIVELPSESSTPVANGTFSPRVTRKRSRTAMNSEPQSATTEPWSGGSQRFIPIPDDASPMSVPGSSASSGPSSIPPNMTNKPNPGNGPSSMVPFDWSTGPSSNNSSTQTIPTPIRSAEAAQAFNLDPSLLSTSIGSLLQSPAAAELFLNSLNNSIQGQALTSTPQGMVNGHNPTLPQINNGQSVSLPNSGYFSSNPNTDPTMALFSPLPNQAALMENSDTLTKSYQDAAAMGGDVDKLQESIDSLVRSMGLQLNDANGDQHFDPTNAAPTMPRQAPQMGVKQGTGRQINGPGIGVGNNVNGNAGGLSAGTSDSGSAGVNGIVPGQPSIPDDFDVDEFLENMAKQQGDDIGVGDGM